MNQYRIVIISAEAVRESYIKADKYERSDRQGTTTLRFIDKEQNTRVEIILASCMSIVVAIVKPTAPADSDE